MECSAETNCATDRPSASATSCAAEYCTATERRCGVNAIYVPARRPRRLVVLRRGQLGNSGSQDNNISVCYRILLSDIVNISRILLSDIVNISRILLSDISVCYRILLSYVSKCFGDITLGGAGDDAVLLAESPRAILITPDSS